MASSAARGRRCRRASTWRSTSWRPSIWSPGPSKALYALGPHWSAGSCSNYNGGGPDGLAACERFGAVFTTLMGVYFGLAGFQG